ncbi:hypothetical protein RJ639_026772 [Escallonia herrerae]|uniref:Cytochrome P450 n=1 Tax=Escallonia herrerae TaxID=1293975 RepID=A0AA89BKV8_9ASTE|nr:hypothetical protein RJ639_026772 [Escallonia herrerae]
MEAPSLLVLAVALLAALAILSRIFNFPSPANKFPPGPKPWPIIVGSFPVVIASSAEMAKQLLKAHDHIFASRPPTAAGKYTTYNCCNITWAPYGPYWRQG